MNPILGNQDNNKSFGNSYYNNQMNNYNQIPNMPNRKKYKHSKKADITVIIKIFAVIIILFGMMLIGKSVYALSQEQNRKRDNPNVNAEKMGKEVTISITTEKPIKEFRYKWNDGEDSVVPGDGTINIEKTIEIPNGNNILNIAVIDYYGYKSEYYKQYIYESSDIEKPKIEIAVVGNRLKITASDETKISYMAYKWNDEDETRFDADEGETEITQEIHVMEGTNELTVIAVDGEENKTTRIEKIIGDNKPEIYISTEGNNVVVTAKDDEEIKKIEVDVDGQLWDSGEESLKQKEVSAKVPITAGTHTVRVTITNLNGLQTTKEVTASM